MHPTRLVCIAALALAAAGPAAARDYLNANVGITGIAAAIAAGKFSCGVTIQNVHDDVARDVELVVLLPVEVATGALPAGCRAVTVRKGNTDFTGQVRCAWATLNVGQSAGVRIESSVSPHPGSRSCGAFVSSRMPDVDPANNYRSARAP
jgi:hypothetical protein